ncbi:MAG TPA: hypothetical protein VJL08_03440, partial [Dehalococcoidia bacterium]|nr:hypothetical protein [Dehalococcoidia bacterium]
QQVDIRRWSCHRPGLGWGRLADGNRHEQVPQVGRCQVRNSGEEMELYFYASPYALRGSGSPDLYKRLVRLKEMQGLV